jgi:hypothetical protein
MVFENGTGRLSDRYVAYPVVSQQDVLERPVETESLIEMAMTKIYEKKEIESNEQLSKLTSEVETLPQTYIEMAAALVVASRATMESLAVLSNIEAQYDVLSPEPGTEEYVKQFKVMELIADRHKKIAQLQEILDNISDLKTKLIGVKAEMVGITESLADYGKLVIN